MFDFIYFFFPHLCGSILVFDFPPRPRRPPRLEV
jgi:hypothetical protein